jgi:hypothetical protein
MNQSFRTVTATAALLAALALPLASQAATTTSAPAQHYQLQTRLSDALHAGEYDGQLALTVYPSGIVQGTYRPSDGGFRTVTGGLDGKNIWLEIGMQHPLRLTGTFTNGVLATTAQIPGPDTYTLDSVDSVKTP